MRLFALVLPAILVSVFVLGIAVAGGQRTHEVTGELRQWHRVTLTFNGP